MKNAFQLCVKNGDEVKSIAFLKTEQEAQIARLFVIKNRYYIDPRLNAYYEFGESEEFFIQPLVYEEGKFLETYLSTPMKPISHLIKQREATRNTFLDREMPYLLVA